MEENEYRSFYHSINQERCVFEKSVLSRRSNCHHAHRFNLADREGVACRQAASALQCTTTLQHIRDKALFALKLTRIDGPLPHAKEIKVQTGGLYGLQKMMGNSDTTQAIADIAALIDAALERYGDIDSLPYEEIARSIVQFEGRSRTRSTKNKSELE